MSLRIGIDVGGTFTDVAVFDEDSSRLLTIRKYLSDRARPAAVIESIIDELAGKLDERAVARLLHGSTLAVNALIEGTGVRAALLTTRGFRDLYEIGRQWRGENVFDIFAPAPRMLLSRDRIFEIRERVGARGEVIEPLVEEDIAAAVARVREMDVAAIAVCFLFAYANPAHELAAAAAIRAAAPELYVSLSHEVNPQWREYERTASTVANAYIGPLAVRHMRALEEISRRRFPRSRTLIMKSDGGAASARMLERSPIQTVMSGPAAGVIGARHLGNLKKIENLITFDVGGTSCDMAVLPGLPLTKNELSVARHPLRCQAIDVETIGAGGGSIAFLQLGAVLKVGPRSAGAEPGPACYGRGGSEPTLTDALVMLGHLNPNALLEGALPLVSTRAYEAVTAHIATPLGIEPAEAASGILRVLIANVTAAMRTITVERGYDPREFTLLAFGGMGPTIAAAVAGELGIGRILVPRDPGAFSACGMLVTDVRHDRSVTRVMLLEDADVAELESVFAELERLAVDELLGEGFARERLHRVRHAGIRYRGQSYELFVPVADLRTSDDLAQLTRRFHAAHQRRYGHMAQAEAVEIVTFQVSAIAVLPKPAPQTFDRALHPERAPQWRRACFDSSSRDVRVLPRMALAPGTSVQGPAVIEEQTSTTVLHPGERATVDDYLNLEIELS